jgi:hypothetical protein
MLLPSYVVIAQRIRRRGFLGYIDVFLACVFLSVPGCGLPEFPKPAQKLISSHYDLIKHHDYDGALLQYAPECYEKAGKDEWIATLKRSGRDLGDLKDFKVDHWGVQSTKRSGGSDTYVTLTCIVRYTYGSATEKFTLQKSSKDPDFRILGHLISAKRDPTAAARTTALKTNDFSSSKKPAP